MHLRILRFHASSLYLVPRFQVLNFNFKDSSIREKVIRCICLNTINAPIRPAAKQVERLFHICSPLVTSTLKSDESMRRRSAVISGFESTDITTCRGLVIYNCFDMSQIIWSLFMQTTLVFVHTRVVSMITLSFCLFDSIIYDRLHGHHIDMAWASPNTVQLQNGTVWGWSSFVVSRMNLPVKRFTS